MRLLLSLLAVASCAASASLAFATTGGGLYGHVRRGPLRPVCLIGRPCDGPAAHAVLTFWRAGSVVARVQTHADGSYRLRLRPGRYVVRISRRLGVSIDPAVVRVPRAHFARMNFEIDTGIR